MVREKILKKSEKYIEEFKGKIFVIKYGGSMLDDEALSESILDDIISFHQNKIKVVLVHGGGSAISKLMELKGKTPKFIDGLRATDKETALIVDEALSGVNTSLVDRIKSKEACAESVVSREHLTIKAKKKLNALEEDFLGDVSGVDTAYILDILKNNCIPVVSPVGIDDDKNLYNINADIVGAEIAAALKAEKFIMLTNVKGVLKDKADDSTLISHINEEDAKHLIEEGVIAGGMIPKVGAGILALDKGIHKAHIINGRISHSLLKEVFTDEGIGTEIVQ